MRLLFLSGTALTLPILPVAAQTVYHVDTAAEYRAALDAIRANPNSDHVINVTADFSAGGTVTDLGTPAGRSVTITGPGRISNSTLRKSGEGGVVLDPDNGTHFGGSSLQGGTVSVGHDDAFGSGGVTVRGAHVRGTQDLVVDNPFGFSLQGASSAVTAAAGTTFVLSGSLNMDHGHQLTIGSAQDTGTVVLAPPQANAPDATVSLAGGTLRLGNQRAGAFFGLSTMTIASGALLDLNGFNFGARSLSGTGTIGNGSTGRSVLRLGSGEFAGTLKDDILLTKQGTGTLILSGDNRHTGGTVIGEGGRLVMAHTNALGTGALNLGRGTLQTNVDTTLTQAVSTTDGRIDTNGRSVVLAGAVSGNNLQKDGRGTLALNNANALTGQLTLNGGHLALGHDRALGSANLVVTSSGTSVTANTDITLNSLVGWSANVTSGIGAVAGSTLRLAGRVTFGNGATLVVGPDGHGGTVELAQTQAESQPLNAIHLAGGTLRYGSVSAGSSTYKSSMNLDGGTTLDLNGFNTSARNLDGRGTVLNERPVLSDLRIQEGGTFQGSITGNIRLVLEQAPELQQNPGTLTLGGNNTYSGGTQILSGTLRVVGGQALPDSSVVDLRNGVLEIAESEAVAGIQNTSITTRGTLRLMSGATLALGGTGLSSTFNGAITGGGDLAKVGAGTLTLTGPAQGDVGLHAVQGTMTLSGNNTHTGGTSAIGARVIAAHANALGTGPLTLWNGGVLQANANLTLAQDVAVAGGRIDTNGNSVTINGTVHGRDLQKEGAGTLTLGGANTFSGQLVVAGGTLRATRGQALADSTVVDLRNGVLEIADSEAAAGLQNTSTTTRGTLRLMSCATFTLGGTGLSTTFDGTITGQGDLDKVGDGTLTLTGSGDRHTGALHIRNGNLQIAGSFASSQVVVHEDAIVSGTSTIGGLEARGGTVAPGDTVARGGAFGTLTVAGDNSFEAGSTYRVNVNGEGQHDLIDGRGRAELNGGTVQVLASRGSYLPRNIYTILRGTAGRSGTFSGATTDLAFLTPTLSYTPDSVQLILERNDLGFDEAVKTPNQASAGRAADRLPFNHPVHDAILGLKLPEIPHAFDQISGEAHASIASSVLDDSRLIREAALERLRDPFEGAPAPADGSVSTRHHQADRALLNPHRTAVWGQALGAVAQAATDGNAASISRGTGGYIMGIDHQVSDGVKIGIAGGYTQSSFSGARSSSAQIGSYHAATYAGFAIGSGWMARAGASYTRHDIEADRNVAFNLFQDRLSAKYSASTTQAFGELAYASRHGWGTIEPFLQVAGVRVSTAGFAENGGPAALVGRARTHDAVFTTLGARFAVQPFSDLPLTLRGMIGWRHAFGDLRPDARMAFRGMPETFRVWGVPLAKDSFVAEMALDYRITKQATLGVSYSAAVSAARQDHTVKASLSVTW